MALTSLASELEQIARSSPASGNPRVSELLVNLRPLARRLFDTGGMEASGQFRLLAGSLCRLKGSANAAARLDLLYTCCHQLFLTGSAGEAIGFAMHGARLARASLRRIDERRFLGFLGVANNEIGDSAKSIEFQVEALSVAKVHDDLIGQVLCCANLTATLIDLGLYCEAIACSEYSLTLLNSFDKPDNDQLARAFTNISSCLTQLGQTERSETFSRRALKLTPEPTSHKDTIVRLVRETNFVSSLIANGKWSEAVSRANYMNSLAQRFSSPRASNLALMCSGLVEFYVGDAVTGLSKVESASLSFQIGMRPLFIESQTHLVRIYSDLNRPEDALRVLDSLVQHTTSEAAKRVASQIAAIAIGDPLGGVRIRDNLSSRAMVKMKLKMQVAENELSRSRLEMLERMAVAADIREDISGEHGYRVGRLSALLAREIGWDRDACQALDIAARLHDIGKIGIPERILLDERILKEAEKHFIAAHTLVGAEILAKSEIPQVRIAEEIARCHHERWDGAGYPKGLKGQGIPKGARIVALADVFDAMTHGRPYAAAISIEQALDEIAAQRGRQFDPELTDHFLALVRRLAKENPDLDTYLGKAARNSPFLKARARIKELLGQRSEAALDHASRTSSTPLN